MRNRNKNLLAVYFTLNNFETFFKNYAFRTIRSDESWYIFTRLKIRANIERLFQLLMIKIRIQNNIKEVHKYRIIPV